MGETLADFKSHTDPVTCDNMPTKREGRLAAKLRPLDENSYITCTSATSKQISGMSFRPEYMFFRGRLHMIFLYYANDNDKAQKVAILKAEMVRLYGEPTNSINDRDFLWFRRTRMRKDINISTASFAVADGSLGQPEGWGE